MALALWRSGHREKALAWYQRAAEAMPERWATPEGVRKATGHWRPRQQETILAVQAAWAEGVGKVP